MRRYLCVRLSVHPPSLVKGNIIFSPLYTIWPMPYPQNVFGECVVN